MRPALVAAAAQQGWTFSRDQAMRAGYTEREVKALTRPGGEWVVVRWGVYCERSRVDALDSRARWLLKDRASVLSSRRPAVLSHDSAARILEIDTLDPPSAASHLTLYGPRGTRTNSGLTRHRDLLPLCVERVDGLVATSYARTALDIARWHGYRPGLVAIDSVRQLDLRRRVRDVADRLVGLLRTCPGQGARAASRGVRRDRGAVRACAGTTSPQVRRGTSPHEPSATLGAQARGSRLTVDGAPLGHVRGRLTHGIAYVERT